MRPSRRYRILLIAFSALIISLAAGLILYALSNNINLFYTPSQLKQSAVSPRQSIRLGGIVVKNSVQRKRQDRLQVSFKLTDGQESIQVNYVGILPDLFREGQGIVALGTLQDDGRFKASQVLAKHDEKYMPPQLSGLKQPVTKAKL